MTRKRRKPAIDVEVVSTEPAPPSSPPIVVEVKASQSPTVAGSSSPSSGVVVRGVDVHATIAAARQAVEVGERIGELVAGVLSFFSGPARVARKPRASSRRSRKRKR